MIAADELTSVPIFANVPSEVLARVARASADLRLATGEYCAHEGDDRGLFIVLSGKGEVTKTIDGVEKVLGARTPGQLSIAFIHQFLQSEAARRR